MQKHKTGGIIIKRKAVSIFIVLALVLSIVPCAFAAGAGLDNFKKVNTYTQGQFKDVASTAWYSGSVKAGYEYGLILGSSSTSYSPDGYMTLSEAIALAARLHSIYYTGSSDFVQGSPWYQVYINYAIENGIIKNGQYANYSAKATRAQFASIFAAALPEAALSKINQIAVGTIPDVTGTESYGNAVYLLYRAGILTGSNAYGTFNPLKNIQRSEVAAIVTRMADVSLRKTVTLATAKQRAIDCLRNFVMSNYDPDF